MMKLKVQIFALAAALLSIPLAHATDINQDKVVPNSAIVSTQHVKVTSWADYAQKKAALKAQKKSKAITKAEFKEKKKELKMAYKAYKKELKEEYKAKRKALKEQMRALKEERKTQKAKEKAEKKACKIKMKAEKMQKGV